MDLKKSLFGYKKNSVDALIRQLAEKEEQAQSRITALENELLTTTENAKKNMESIQTELVIRQKSLLDLAQTLEERNDRIAELEAKQRTLVSNIESQFRAVISELEEKHDARVAAIEEKNNGTIAGLEEKHQQEIRIFKQNEDQVKQIGMLYINAQEYAEKMKMDSQARVLDFIDRVFDDIGRTQGHYEESIRQINVNKENLEKLSQEMLANINRMRDKVGELDHVQSDTSYHAENIRSAKERIKRQIQEQYAKDGLNRSRQPQSDQAAVSVGRSYPIQYTEAEQNRKPEETVPSIQYAEQIEELKRRIEKQEEMFTSYGFRAAKEEAPKQEAPKQEETGSTPENRMVGGRYEKNHAERETYGRFFAALEKKFNDDDYPPQDGTTPGTEPNDPSAGQRTAGKIEDNNDGKEDGETLPTKKVSIKDILNKYANMN